MVETFNHHLKAYFIWTLEQCMVAFFYSGLTSNGRDRGGCFECKIKKLSSVMSLETMNTEAEFLDEIR